MMSRYGICPVCGSDISEQHHEESWVLCGCGWMGSKNTEVYEKETQKKSIKWILSVSVLILTGFIHTTKWGNDSLVAIPLQAQAITGTASQATLLAYSDLCVKHRLVEDGEHYLSKWAERENTAAGWEKLAILRTQMKSYPEAVLAFDKYYEAEGNNPLTMFHYAQVLEELDRPDLAEQIYLHIVGLDTETYQRTVVEELVRLLVNQQKLKEAKSILVQLSKPNMELPSHLVRQKEWIDQLLKEDSFVNKKQTDS